MTRSVCSRPGCPDFAIFRGLCGRHKLTTSERGYDVRHQEARRSLRRRLPAPCAYGCGTILHPGSRWVAAHVVDGDESRGWVASCGPCNERAKNGQLQPVTGAEIVMGPEPRTELFA